MIAWKNVILERFQLCNDLVGTPILQNVTTGELVARRAVKTECLGEWNTDVFLGGGGGRRDTIDNASRSRDCGPCSQNTTPQSHEIRWESISMKKEKWSS